MQKTHTAQKERREKIGEILKQVSAQPVISERTLALLDRYLLDNENDPELAEVIRKQFDADFKASGKPSREAMETLPRLLEKLGLQPASAPQPATPKVPLYQRMYFKAASAAAIVLVAVGIGVTLNMRPDGDVPIQIAQQVPELTVEAIDGINKDIYLSDNSHVWIDGNSKVTYPEQFSGERHVRLSGHARFDVEHDPARPFVVHTEYVDVRVLGTDFDIRESAAERRTEVVLYEGSVEVTANGRSTRLSPGEMLTYNHVSDAVTVKQGVSGTIAEWRTDYIFAPHKTIPELLLMIGSYYDVEIVFDSAQFDSERYMFGFDKSDPIEKVMGVVSDIGGGFGYTFSQDSTKIEIK